MEQAMTKREIETIVREVTDEEVAFYHEYGWVMMPRLVDPEFAVQLLRVGQEWVDRNAQEVGHGNPRAGLARNQETEPFRSFMFSERMAQNATRLVNRKRVQGRGRSAPLPRGYPPKQAPWRNRGPSITRTRPSTAPTESASSSSGWRWRKSHPRWVPCGSSAAPIAKDRWVRCSTTTGATCSSSSRI